MFLGAIITEMTESRGRRRLAELPTSHQEMSAGRDAGDDVGGHALPLAVVVLADGVELQAAIRQDAVFAHAWLSYLRQDTALSRRHRNVRPASLQVLH